MKNYFENSSSLENMMQNVKAISKATQSFYYVLKSNLLD